MGKPADKREAARLIREAERLLFFLHVNPDGDCIGSTLGLGRALEQTGKHVVLVGVDPCPHIYRFLPGWDRFTPWQEIEGAFDLAVFLDCGDVDRVGAARPLIERARMTLNIDHHATNGLFADHNWVDTSAAAVGEMVFALVEELNLILDAGTADCLYTAISTDTGSFQYESTTPVTHRVTARLLECGAGPYQVAQAVYESDSLPRLHLLARSLASLRVALGGRVGVIHVTGEMLAATGAVEEDVEGIVNFARKVAGVEAGLLLRERPGGEVRVSLRSRGTVDVGRVAQALGGGGHPQAAGCTVPGPIAAAEERLLAALAAALAGTGRPGEVPAAGRGE